MTFEVLISTMNGDFLNKKIDVSFPYILINQYSKKEPDVVMSNIYNYKEKGLAKSRNIAIEKSTADICLISDDDIEYMSNIEDIIVQKFQEYPSADIITFQIQLPEGDLYKNYPKEVFWHTTKTLMGVASVEIAFKREAIKEKNIQFDELFGLGSTFATGEEIIFLTDALKKGLRILYVPIPIVIHPLETSGKNYDNMSLIQAKGAMFYRIFSIIGYPISMLYAYKKYRYSPFSLKNFTMLMFEGITQYRSS